MSAYKRRKQEFNDRLAERADELKAQGKITPTVIHLKPVKSDVYKFFTSCVRAVKERLK